MPLIGTADGSAECANLIARVKGQSDVSAPIVNDPERGPVYKCDILANPGEAWDCQFFIKSNEVLQAGDKVNLKFMYRSDDTRNIETQAHGEPAPTTTGRASVRSLPPHHGRNISSAVP